MGLTKIYSPDADLTEELERCKVFRAKIFFEYMSLPSGSYMPEDDQISCCREKA